MIYYSCKSQTSRLQLLIRLSGSAAPSSCLWALPCGVASALVKYCRDEKECREWFGWETWDEHPGVLSNTAPWTGFTVLVAFLIVFRASQSYGRYMQAIQCCWDMRTLWYEAVSCLVAFLAHSKHVDAEEVTNFKHLLVRLFSMLHACALVELHDRGPDSSAAAQIELPIIDEEGVSNCLQILDANPCKLAVVFQWIQVTMVDAQKSGILSIPPPILSRVFQQLGRGITVFHDALKLAEIPLPFCYAQAVDLLLVMHWLVTPAVVHIWTTTAGWAGCAGFLVSFIAFCLNSTAVTIESPFGRDANDLGWEEFQREFNMYLLVLLTPVALAPSALSRRADVNGCNEIAESKERLLVEHCFVSAWMSEHRQDLWMRLRSCNTLEVTETRELSTILERASTAGLSG